MLFPTFLFWNCCMVFWNRKNASYENATLCVLLDQSSRRSGMCNRKAYDLYSTHILRDAGTPVQWIQTALEWPPRLGSAALNVFWSNELVSENQFVTRGALIGILYGPQKPSTRSSGFNLPRPHNLCAQFDLDSQGRLRDSDHQSQIEIIPHRHYK